jgi:hypothetical protein
MAQVLLNDTDRAAATAVLATTAKQDGLNGRHTNSQEWDTFAPLMIAALQAQGWTLAKPA